MSLPVEYVVDSDPDHWLGTFQYSLPAVPSVGDYLLVDDEEAIFQVLAVGWVLSDEGDLKHVRVNVERVDL